MLEEACNPAHPLLERLRFLSISGNNLDEFFMVRVAGLTAHRLLGVEELSDDGMTPAQQLAAISEELDRLTQSQQQVWAELQAGARRGGHRRHRRGAARRGGGRLARPAISASRSSRC